MHETVFYGLSERVSKQTWQRLGAASSGVCTLVAHEQLEGTMRKSHFSESQIVSILKGGVERPPGEGSLPRAYELADWDGQCPELPSWLASDDSGLNGRARTK